MSEPIIQYFASSGTRVKPPNAVRVDIVLKGGDGGNAMESDGESFGGEGGGHSAVYPGNRAASAAYVSVVCNPRPSAAPAGSPGSLSVDSFDAADLPGTVEVEVGKGGKPGGRDGYALIVTHLADGEDENDPVAYTRERTTSPATLALLDEVERGRERRHAPGEQR